MVPFPGPGLADSIPPDWSPAQKVTFLGVQFRDCFLGASEGSRREFSGSFWRVQGRFFLFSEQDCVRHVKKLSFRVFLGAKSKRLVLQKHANRTVHPSKIEGARPLLSVLLPASQGGPFWGFKSVYLSFQLVRDFLVFRRLVQTFHFESFRRLQEVKFGALLA